MIVPHTPCELRTDFWLFTLWYCSCSHFSGLSLPFWNSCYRLDCTLKWYCKVLMMLHHTTKTGGTFWIWVSTKTILESKLNDSFCPPYMERGMWQSGRNSQATSCSCQFVKAIQWPKNNTTSVVWSGMQQHTCCFSTEDYVKQQSGLERHFELSHTIPGTRKLHSYDSTVEVKF